jgi:ribonuclease BN (tRNA processing enzyme)
VPAGVTVTFAGSGDTFSSGGRFQACIHLQPAPAPGPQTALPPGPQTAPAATPARARSPPCSDAGGTVIASTGDTAWTPAIAAAADGADLLIAEAYHWDKPVPHHLRHADLAGHHGELRARCTVLTHMSADMLGHQEQARHETARDGLVVRV